MRQTTMAKPSTVVRNWYVVDAEGVTLGRLASEVAHILHGKHKVTYTPHVEGGDYVIVVNAEKAIVTGDQESKKFYYRHSGYAGGLRTRSTGIMKEKYPVEWVEKQSTECYLIHVWEMFKELTYLFIKDQTIHIKLNNLKS